MGRASKMRIGETAATRVWENEGGSIRRDPALSLPDGITAVTVMHYRVGPYVYSRLDDARGEARRRSRADPD